MLLEILPTSISYAPSPRTLWMVFELSWDDCEVCSTLDMQPSTSARLEFMHSPKPGRNANIRISQDQVHTFVEAHLKMQTCT